MDKRAQNRTHPRELRAESRKMVWLGLVFTFVGTACGKGASETTATVEARRLVSVAPALTAIVVDLGAAEELVGVTRYCTVPANVTPGPTIIGDFRPTPERVLKARPTHVLMADYATQANERAGLEALGLPVTTFELVTLADLAKTVTTLGAMLDRSEKAAALNAALDAAKAKLATCLGPDDRGRRPSFALIYGMEPGFVYTTGGGDHIAELLGLTGASNALSTYPRTARIGLERVLQARPDLILHVAPTDDLKDSAAALAFWGRWPEVPAVAHHAVHVWPDSRLARNGTHLAELASDLCASVRGAASEPEPAR